MGFPIKLRARATKAQHVTARTLARVSFEPIPKDERGNYVRVIDAAETDLQANHLDGFAGLLVCAAAESEIVSTLNMPTLLGFPDFSWLTQGSVVAIGPNSLDVNVLYRPESYHNTIFSTGRCNSNCLMCSQPPVIKDDNSITLEHLRLIELIPNEPEVLGITGGEPTLLGDGLVQIISRLKERIPKTKIHMLTNGRMYAYKNFTKALGEVCHPGFLSAIPLYSDVAAEHDYVVQAKGAFDQTIVGLYNAARFGLETEIRVVLHKQTIPRLVPLMEFIYRNLSFVGHVALMGLENMGYVKKNWNSLWIDPVDYRDTLLAAVRHLCYRGMNVSVYNLPLCILPKTVWPFAQQSISDFKNIYLDECNCCNARKYCAGLFSSSESRHSRGIATIAIEEDELQSIFRPTAVCAA